jgi:hypothetical protein
MISLKLDVPKDFAAQVTRQFETQISAHLRKDGIRGITVKIGKHGQAVFSGPADELKKIEKSLEKWR